MDVRNYSKEVDICMGIDAPCVFGTPGSVCTFPAVGCVVLV